MFKVDAADSSQSWTEITDLSDRILTELDNPSLVLGKLDENKYSLDMNTTYKIRGSIIMEEGRFMEDEIVFQTVSPLSIPNKRCSVTPVEGLVLETNFTVNCSGWAAKHSNLTYTFRYVSLQIQ